jgi:cell division protein ZapA
VSVTFPREAATNNANAGANANSSQNKRSMNLELFGQRLTVLSDTDEERVKDIVDFVNRKLEEVRDSSKRVQTDQIALLAALNIAEELFRERQKSAALRRRVRERSVKLLAAIDQVAAEHDSPEVAALATTAAPGSGERGDLGAEGG